MVHRSHPLPVGEGVARGYRSVVSPDRGGHLAPKLVAYDVAGSEDVRRARPQILIHHHLAVAVCLDPGFLQAHAFRIGAATGSDEQPLGPHLLPAL